MLDKDRFHNQLALNLGYQCIVNDKRITIDVDEADDPWVTLKIQGHPDTVRFKASGDANEMELNNTPAMQEEIKSIIDAAEDGASPKTRSINNVDLLKRISQLEKAVFGDIQATTNPF